MKKIIFILLLCLAHVNTYSYMCIRDHEWNGSWGDSKDCLSIIPDLPFHSTQLKDQIIIKNEIPDRCIYFKVVDENLNILKSGNINIENSAQITISISDLPDNGIYTIILTSPNPNDRVWSQFEK